MGDTMKISSSTASLLAFAVVACASPLPQPIQPHQQVAFSTPSPVMNTVNIIDDTLQRTTEKERGGTIVGTKLAVEGAGQNMTATNSREVWVNLRNLTDYPQNIEARVTWYDVNERPVDGPTSWTRIFLPQNAGEIYRSQSISLQADAFYVEVRELN